MRPLASEYLLSMKDIIFVISEKGTSPSKKYSSIIYIN